MSSGAIACGLTSSFPSPQAPSQLGREREVERHGADPTSGFVGSDPHAQRPRPARRPGRLARDEQGTVRTAIAKTRLAGAPVNAGCRPISAARPALTATYAVNAGHAADPRGRPALTGGPNPSSMPPSM